MRIDSRAERGSRSSSLAWVLRRARADTPSSRPNVVIFLADDAGWGDYSHSGNRQVSTPNIDSLAARRVARPLFVCPVCAPTRAEFLTGRYHPRGGVPASPPAGTARSRRENHRRRVSRRPATRPAPSANGTTAASGRITRSPAASMNTSATPSGHWGEYFDPPLEQNGRMIRSRATSSTSAPTGRSTSSSGTKQAVLLLRPVHHAALAVGRARRMTGSGSRTSRSRSAATTRDAENIDETRCVLAMIENHDGNVGRVLAKLDELGLSRQHDRALLLRQRPEQLRWNGGMKGSKGSTDEGGVRSSCFLRWPARLPAGHDGHADRRRDRPVADADRAGRRAARRRQAARRPRPQSACCRSEATTGPIA